MSDAAASPPSVRPALRVGAWGEALLAVAAALLLRALAEPLMQGRFPFLGLYVATTVVALRHGVLPAMLVLAGGAAVTELLAPLILAAPHMWEPTRSQRLQTLTVAAGMLLPLLLALRWYRDRLLQARAEAAALAAVERERERAAAAADRRLAAVVRQASDGIISVSTDGVLLSWNPAAERIFGYTAAEAVGQPMNLLATPDQATEQREILGQVMQGRTVVRDTVRRHKSGQLVPVSTSVAPMFDDHQRVVGLSAVLQDISERKRAEAEQQQAARQKDEFIAILAHELRNPLAPLVSSVSVLRRQGEDAQARDRALAVMDRQLSHMVRLVNDLLDVHRITQGRLALQCRRLPLAQVIDDAVDTSLPLLQARDHRLQQEVEAGLQVQADPTRLAQVLANLLNNAAKYTPPGGLITLRAARRGDQVRIEVVDNGIGIPPDQLQRVFELFTQVQQDGISSMGGLGIGLSVAQRLVALHGGQLHAHSDGPGRGSCFSVTLPLLTAP